MMEEVTSRPSVEYIPPLPPKMKQNAGSTSFTKISREDTTLNGFDVTDSRSNMSSLSSMHSLVLNSKTPSTTVFVAATQPEQSANTLNADALTSNGPHVVTIRINTETEKSKAPKISSVHLKSDNDFDTFKLNDICKKNSSLVRLNVEDSQPKIIEEDESVKTDKAPYIYCNAFMNSMTNTVMSSGQCSPSDTLDSGTCSDLDATPPPLPKKKTSKVNCAKKTVSVTVLNSANEIDFEDNDSNISCDSLNSSELNGCLHAEDKHNEVSLKKEKKDITDSSPTPPQMPSFFVSTNNIDNSFLPQGLLQDIRDRSVKLTTVETEGETIPKKRLEEVNQNNNVNLSKESVQLTSYLIVLQLNSAVKNNVEAQQPTASNNKKPLISESTYEERKKQEKLKQELCYSSNYFDTDKYYDFHLNEKQFDDCKSVKSANGVSVKSGSDETSDIEYFAGLKDYKNEDGTSTIKSSKGTIRGVKNRVRAGIATFLQIQSITKSYKEKDAGKVVLYATTMGIVRSTYQRCLLVKKILRNLLIKYEERDVFMSTEYQDEIRDRMRSDQILVPQLFIDGQHIGDADTVEKLNECGELRKMLKPYKSPDACTTCQVCGGFRLLPCRICNGSKKSLHRNHFTAEFVALKCMNCDEVGLVRCEACS